MRSLLFAAAVLCSLFIPQLSATAAPAKRPPNIVFFLVDDMGWNDTQPYGNKFHETPNVVKLAKQGLRFTNAYAACPVCSPTRASIMSGRYPARVGVTDFIPGHLRPWAKLVVPPIHNQLELSEVSLAEAVKPAGYVCASFGKWHLGGRPFFPDKQGFDEYVVSAGRHFGFRTFPKVPIKKGEYLADFLTDRAERFIEKNRDKPFLLYLPHYAVHIPLEAKERLIVKYRKKVAKPEFRPKLVVTVRTTPVVDISDTIFDPSLMVDAEIRKHPVGKHVAGSKLTPVTPRGGRTYRIVYEFDRSVSIDDLQKLAADVSAKVASTKKPPGFFIDVRLSPVNNPTYAAMVEHIDQSLGRIMKTLDDLKLADNTVLIFFSDNGGLYRRFDAKGPAVMSNHPLRGEKGTLYEGGIREPCIIRWPGVVKPGTTSDVPITSVDFWPTIAEIAGTRAKFTHTIDGVSLMPLLKRTGTLKNRALYWHYPHYHHTSPGGAIRYGDYKLIEYFEDGRLELYNLKKDLGETTDLAKKEPKKVKELHAMLKSWRKSVGAKMPTKNPDYDPKRAGEWRPRRTFKRKPAKN
jgi:arylsulfatase A-like enzyme